MTSFSKSTVSEHYLNKIVHILEESDDDWFGPDRDLKVSLGDMKWVAKDNGGDSWTVILNITGRYVGGPGYKIEVVTLDDIKEFIFSDDFDHEVFGIDDLEFYWNYEDTIHHIDDYVTYNDELKMASHYWDRPFSGNDLIEILEDVYNEDSDA